MSVPAPRGGAASPAAPLREPICKGWVSTQVTLALALVLLAALAGVLCLSSCTASPQADSAPSQSVDVDSLLAAASEAQQEVVTDGSLALGSGVLADFSSVESGFYDIDVSAKQISISLVANLDDVLAGCELGENAMKLLDVKAYPSDDVSEGFGSLYEEYSVIIHVDNPAGTLDLDGMREAGTDGSVNWQ